MSKPFLLGGGGGGGGGWGGGGGGSGWLWENIGKKTNLSSAELAQRRYLK